MRARGGGTIVTIGSTGGRFTSPGAGGYHIVRYSVEALSLALRAEVAQLDVRVVLIDPTGYGQDSSNPNWSNPNCRQCIHTPMTIRTENASDVTPRPPARWPKCRRDGRRRHRRPRGGPGGQSQKAQTPLYRRGVWKRLGARPAAVDRPDVGPGHDAGPQDLKRLRCSAAHCGRSDTGRGLRVRPAPLKA